MRLEPGTLGTQHPEQAQGDPRGRGRAWRPWVCTLWGCWTHILLLSKVTSKRGFRVGVCPGPGQRPQTRGAGVQGREQPRMCWLDQVLHAGKTPGSAQPGASSHSPPAHLPQCPGFLGRGSARFSTHQCPENVRNAHDLSG